MSSSLSLDSNNNNNNNETLTWRVVLFDFDDQEVRGHVECLEGLASILGKENVEYARRQFYVGRNVLMAGKDLAEPFEPLGRPANLSVEEQYGPRPGHVHMIRYPVRTDMKHQIDARMEQYRQSTNQTTLHIVTKERQIDVASFTPTYYVQVSSQTLRGYVSEVVQNLSLTEYTISETTTTATSSVLPADDSSHQTATSISLDQQQGGTQNKMLVHFGLAGFTDEVGRSTPQDRYMDTMLRSKIVVTCQRDGHEDHYRFFEAVLSGALVMTDPMHPLPAGYEHGKNVVVYTSLKEVRELILYYVEHPTERLKIARAGYDLAMSRHRSWHVMERILLYNSSGQ